MEESEWGEGWKGERDQLIIAGVAALFLLLVLSFLGAI